MLFHSAVQALIESPLGFSQTFGDAPYVFCIGIIAILADYFFENLSVPSSKYNLSTGL